MVPNREIGNARRSIVGLGRCHLSPCLFLPEDATTVESSFAFDEADRSGAHLPYIVGISRDGHVKMRAIWL